jgi:hypothetical protein
MATRKRQSVAKRVERVAISTGTELGTALGRLEKDARTIVRKGIEMQAKARDRSVRLMRSASRELGKLASQLEGSGKPARRKKRK